MPSEGSRWLDLGDRDPDAYFDAEVRDMMVGWDYAGMAGWWMIAAMGIFAIAVLGSVWLIVHRPGADARSRSTAEEILRERFARGELTGEQFDEAKRRLG